MGTTRSASAGASATWAKSGEPGPISPAGQILAISRPMFPTWRHDLERHYLAVFEIPPRGTIGSFSKGTRAAIVFRLMNGADYFFDHRVPWTGLAVSLALGTALIAVSVRLVEQRDF
jgi:hypothetical protein